MAAGSSVFKASKVRCDIPLVLGSMRFLAAVDVTAVG